MPIRKSENEWERLGRSDPYYGVVSLDKFRKGKMDPAARSAFFQSGQEHIDFILEIIRDKIDPAFAPKRALDFGSGVGRCAIPLAKQCESVVGMDVSPSMLEEARANCEEQGVTNIEHTLGDGDLSGLAGGFDLIHSFIVFQHITPKKGEKILKGMIEKLHNNGVLAVQLLYAREETRFVKALGWLRIRVPLVHNFANLVYGKSFREPLMEKNCYDLNRVFLLVQNSHCGHVHAMFQGKGRLKSILLFIQKKAQALPYDNFYDG